jgi:hypothetical protein
VAAPPTPDELLAAVRAHWAQFRRGFRAPPTAYGIADYVAALRKRIDDALVSQAAGIDPVVTGSTAPEGRR